MAGLGFDLVSPQTVRRSATEIVAWGDSLTAGASASAALHRYPEAAGRMFDPPRSINNRGIGGQTSTQIAARQGSLPILCTLAGDAIPTARDIAWRFENGTEGFRPRGGNPLPLVSAQEGQLVVTGQGGGFCRANADLPEDLPPGTSVRIALDLVRGTHAEVGLVDARYPASGAWAGQSHILPTSGRFERTSVLTGTGRAFSLYIGSATGTNRIFNASLRATQPVAVTAKSVNVLLPGSAYQTMAGTLAGVSGVMSTDANGAWSFKRSDAGAAVPCPPGTPFVPNEAIADRPRTAWIWAGRNNFADAPTVLNDVAAMVAHLPHTRFLVGSVLNAAAEGVGTAAHTAIVQLNGDLAARYGRRFVDLRRALIEAGDPVADAADLSKDVVPGSLRSDTVHLNDAGYAVVARAMRDATRALGW